MTDPSLQSISTVIQSTFDRHATHVVTAQFQEHTERTRIWNQDQLNVFYDLGPGRWHTQLWRSWWQAPNSWRHECISVEDPTYVISGLLVQHGEWWAYRSSPQIHSSASRLPVITRRGRVGRNAVPLLTGTGGEKARMNAAKWQWVDPALILRVRSWEWGHDKTSSHVSPKKSDDGVEGGSSPEPFGDLF